MSNASAVNKTSRAFELSWLQVGPAVWVLGFEHGFKAGMSDASAVHIVNITSVHWWVQARLIVCINTSFCRRLALAISVLM